MGGFTPVVLYRPDHDPAPEIDRVLDGFEAVGAKVLVLSADSGMVGYDARPDLDSVGWDTLLSNLDRLAAVAAARGVTAVLHPHVGTMIEKGDEVQRVLENSSISLCLDTGHLLIGGTDPAVLTRQAPERIAHTHLKDVDAGLAKRVQAGELTYTEAVGKGMYRILGRVTSTSPASSRSWRARDMTAGTSWNRTPSCTRRPPVPVRSTPLRPAPTTSARSSRRCNQRCPRRSGAVQPPAGGPSRSHLFPAMSLNTTTRPYGSLRGAPRNSTPAAVIRVSAASKSSTRRKKPTRPAS